MTVPYSEIGEFSSLYRWCRAQPCIKTGNGFDGTSIPVSHNSLCAKTKSFHVDTDMLSAFYIHAAKAWHEPTFLSENGVPIHILFWDLDIVVQPSHEDDGDHKWEQEHTMTVASYLVQCLHGVIPDTRCVVTWTEPQPVDALSNLVKVGIHMYFPHVFVNTPLHLRIRQFLLGKLGADLDVCNGLFRLHKNWADVLDKAVCQSPRLRMLTASKAGACFHTKEERVTLKCAQKRHRVNLGRRYHIAGGLHVTGEGVVPDTDFDSKYADVNGTSQSGLPERVELRTELLMLVSLRRTATTVSSIEFPEGVMASYQELADEMDNAGTAEVLFEGKDVSEELDTVVRLWLHQLGLVSDVHGVQKVVSVGNPARPAMYVAYLNTGWCFNHGTDHTANRVFVQIQPGLRLVVRCHHSSDRVSDQGFKCQCTQQIYCIQNNALQLKLFSRVAHKRAVVSQMQHNNKCVDPLAEWAIMFSTSLETERTREQKRARRGEESAE